MGKTIVTSIIIEVVILSDGAMCAIPVPFDPKEVFGKLRMPVKVTINGYIFRSTIANMCGETFIPLRKDNRQAAAVEAGDKVIVKIEADVDARNIAVPDDLAKALQANPCGWEQWENLSYTFKRESVESICGAKKPETRERRIKNVVDLVAQKAGSGATKNGVS